MWVHQINMTLEDKKKIAFSIENRRYECLRMPLKNTSVTACNGWYLQGLSGRVRSQLMNDEHTRVYGELGKSFTTSSKNKFQYPTRQISIKREVAFLEHIVTSEGIKPNPEKIKDIMYSPIMRSTRKIKALVGLLRYYRKFIKYFAQIMRLFTVCLMVNSDIKHDENFI